VINRNAVKYRSGEKPFPFGRKIAAQIRGHDAKVDLANWDTRQKHILDGSAGRPWRFGGKHPAWNDGDAPDFRRRLIARNPSTNAAMIGKLAKNCGLEKSIRNSFAPVATSKKLLTKVAVT